MIQSGSQVTEEKERRLSPLMLYTSLVSALGIVVLLSSLAHLSTSLPDVLLFIGLIALSELTTSEVFTAQLALSMSSAVYFAALLLFGPLPAALVSIVGGLTTTIVRDFTDKRRDKAPLLQRVLFNMAAFGIAVTVSGWLYTVTGGKVGNITSLSNLLPAALAAMSIEVLNAALVIGAISIQTGHPAFQIWRQNISWAMPMKIVTMIIGGGGLALGYHIAGILGGVVFFLPIVLTVYAFRIYVEQTKAHVHELEENIAERKRAEERLKASLKEKEVLLQEIHHRVKNNLQVISSLLYLQSKKVKDQEAYEMFQESRNRVRSMALVHEKLYQSTDLSSIDFARYIQNLAGFLFRSYNVSSGEIKLELDVEDVFLSIDTAVPCGLIINELVSNALKHAFSNGRGGKIRIELHSDRSGKMTLTVSDDGVGFPEDFDPANSESLGLQLVNTLVGQLEGTIESKTSHGTTFIVVFSEYRHSDVQRERL